MNRLRFRDNRRGGGAGRVRVSVRESEGVGGRERSRPRKREREGERGQVFIASCCSRISGDATVLGLCRFHIA